MSLWHVTSNQRQWERANVHDTGHSCKMTISSNDKYIVSLGLFLKRVKKIRIADRQTTPYVSGKFEQTGGLDTRLFPFVG